MFPPRPSMRLVRDTIAFTAAEMPRWHSISISGYHIREAGSTAAEELAFTLANGFAYVELGDAGRASRSTRSRRGFVLLQRPHRLLRGDREVPRGTADLGAVDARAVRRPERAVDAAALPHPDRGGVAHRAAARGEHRPHRDRGVGGGARRHAVAAHQLDGRGAGAADREGGADRAAHAAGARVRDERRQRRRPIGRLVLRRGAHRRDGAPVPRSCSPSSTRWVTARCSRA